MSSSPALSDQADRASQRDEDAQYYRQVLHKFIAMGTDLAEAVHRQALAAPAAAPQSAAQSQPEDEPAAPSPTSSQATTFDRLARTVRRTIALARKLSEPAREAPGPKLRLKECPNQRCTDRAETDALNAEPWAEPCERPEGPDCDANEDLDEQSLDDLIASLRHGTGLATLTDAQLRQHATLPRASTEAASTGPESTAHLESAPSRPGSHDPIATPPTQPGTGPP